MKKMTMMIVLVMASYMLVLVSPVCAETYITGQIGLFMPDESFLDDGYNAEFAYGKSLVEILPGLANKHHAWKNVTAEVGIGYRHADGETGVSIPGISTTTTKVDLDVIPVTLSAVYNHKIGNSPFKVYGGVGLGVYYTLIETDITTTDIFFGTTTVSEDDSEFNFGVLVKGGVLFSLNERLDLNAGLQNDLLSDDAEGICLNFGVRYSF